MTAREASDSDAVWEGQEEDPLELELRMAELRAEMSSPHECDRLELRLRTSANGSQHIARQCLGCGEQRGNAVGRKVAELELNGRPAAPFDESLADLARQAYRDMSDQYEALHKAREDILFPEHQKAHAAWREADAEQRKEQLASVTASVEGLVAEMGEDKALDLLVKQICDRRKQAWDEALKLPGRFQSEPELKSADFDLHEEVKGRHLAHGTGVQIDYIATAKPHLVAAGFVSQPFGIEVKYINPAEGFSKKAARAFWQTISYTDCTFNLGGESQQLKFAMLFSNLSFEAERALLKQHGVPHENDFVAWRTMLQLANHAGVGLIELPGTRYEPKGWALRFSGGTYFVRRDGRDPLYRLSNANMVEKIRVGNF
jgi:hypothetical protein